MTNDTSHSFTNLRLVEQMQKLTVPRQRALISMLAICDKHDLQPDEILSSFSNDLPRTPLEDRRRTRRFYWSRVQDLADETKQDHSNSSSTFEKAAGHLGLLPDFANIAMRIQNENETQDEFNHAWLNRAPDYLHDQSQPRSLFVQAFTVALKLVFVLWVITYVMIRIVPELKGMAEEFEMERQMMLEVSITLFATLAKFWFLPALILILLVPFFFNATAHYLKRWNPFTWQSRERSVDNKRRELLALQLSHQRVWNFDQSMENQFDYQFDEEQPVYNRRGSEPKTENLTNEEEIDWKQVQSNWKISSAEVRLLTTAGSSDVQGWLLSRSVEHRGRRERKRSEFWTQLLVTSVNVIIVIFVLLIAVTMITTLTSIMTNLL